MSPLPCLVFRAHRKILVALAPLFAAAFAATAQAAELDYPIHVAAKSGTAYVADRYLPGIWTLKDGKLDLYHQASKTFRTPLNAVRCLAIDSEGRLLAGDSATRQVYRFEDGKPKPLLKGPAGIGIPIAIAIAREGTVYAADLESQRIWKTGSDGGEPEEVLQIPGIRSIALDADDRIWALTNTPKAVVRINDGKAEPVLSERTFANPQHIAINEGIAYISDGYAGTIWRVTADGKAEKWASGDPLQHPVGTAWDENRLLVTDSKRRTVFTIDTEGHIQPALAPKAPGPK